MWLCTVSYRTCSLEGFRRGATAKLVEFRTRGHAQEVEPKPHLFSSEDYQRFSTQKKLWNIHIMYKICFTLGCLPGVLPVCRVRSCLRAFYVDLQSLAYFPRIIVGRWVFVLFTIIIRSSLLPRCGSRRKRHSCATWNVCVLSFEIYRFDI